MLYLRFLFIIALSLALLACGSGSGSKETKEEPSANAIAECGYKAKRQTKSVDLFDGNHSLVTGSSSAGITAMKAEYTYEIQESNVQVNETNARIFVHILAKSKRDWHKLGIFENQSLASIKDGRIALDLSKLKAVALEPLELIERISISIESKVPYRFTEDELETIANGTLKCAGATLKGQNFSSGVTFNNEVHRVEIADIKLSSEVLAEIQRGQH